MVADCRSDASALVLTRLRRRIEPGSLPGVPDETSAIRERTLCGSTQCPQRCIGDTYLGQVFVAADSSFTMRRSHWSRAQTHSTTLEMPLELLARRLIYYYSLAYQACRLVAKKICFDFIGYDVNKILSSVFLCLCAY
jgi:hypothetical protein